MENFWITFIISIVFFFCLFLILRELFCWYWKINERITLQTETNNLLKDLINVLSNNTETYILNNPLKTDNFTIDDIDLKRFDNFIIAKNDFINDLNWESAIKECSNLGLGWRLPTFDELKIIYLHKKEISGIKNTTYISSTEIENMAYTLNFENGYERLNNKDYLFTVRAVKTVK